MGYFKEVDYEVQELYLEGYEAFEIALALDLPLISVQRALKGYSIDDAKIQDQEF